MLKHRQERERERFFIVFFSWQPAASGIVIRIRESGRELDGTNLFSCFRFSRLVSNSRAPAFPGRMIDNFQISLLEFKSEGIAGFLSPRQIPGFGRF